MSTIFLTALLAIVFLIASFTIKNQPPCRPFSIQPLSDLEDWSSFPSDHAAYLSALAFGLAYISRRLTVPIVLYTAGWICLPRLYLGVHYATDIIVGLGIRTVTVWALFKVDWLRSFLATRVLGFLDEKPHWFYMIAFLATFEMGDLFWDVRGPVHLLMHSVSSGAQYHSIIRYGVLLLGSFGLATGIRLSTNRVGYKRRDIFLLHERSKHIHQS